MFSVPVPELWLSVDDWEVDRDKERRAALRGRSLNSCFWSVNCICYGDRKEAKKRGGGDYNGFIIANSTICIKFDQFKSLKFGSFFSSELQK